MTKTFFTTRRHVANTERTSIHFIVNPKAAGGQTEQRWQQILPLIKRFWGANFRFYLPQNAQHTQRLAFFLTSKGCQTLVVMGGDGTIQHVVNGILMAPKSQYAQLKLGILSSGTGQGLAMSLKLPLNITKQLQIIKNGYNQKLDLLQVRYHNSNAAPQSRWCVNECQIGIGGRIVQVAEGRLKRLTGRWAFTLSALQQLFRFGALEMKITTVDGSGLEGPLVGLCVGNGSFTAGGMRLTPKANLFDGQLDVLGIKPQSFSRRFLNFSKVFTGKHIWQKEFVYYQTRGLTVFSAASSPVAADGEMLGYTPCSVRLEPAVLSVFIPRKEETHEMES